MSTRNILLVDDSKSARYALRLLLQKNNLDVDTADSAETALGMISESLPDAIFMDHLMPGMNGFEALETLKNDTRTAHIPVVMCTSNDEEQYQIQAREKGALGILPKPADQEKLHRMLRLIETAIAKSSSARAEPTPAAGPATTAGVPTMDQDAVTAMIQDTLDGLLETRIEPMVLDKLEDRLQTLKTDLGERLLSASAARLAEWSEAESARLRDEMAGADSAESLTAKLEQDIKDLRAELVKMETSHAHAVVVKLTREVLPDMVHNEIEKLGQQLYRRLVEELPQTPQLLRQVSGLAEATAEHTAAKIAKSHARQVAEDSAEVKAGEMTDFLMSAAEDTNKRVRLLAGGAAVIGVLSSVLVYFFVS